MMTGHPGIFAGGDMVPSERTVTVAIGHGKLAARNIDAWLRGQRLQPPAEPHGGRASPCCICRCSATPIRQPQQRLADARPDSRLRRGAGRPDRTGGSARGAALPRLRQLLRMRQLLRRLSREAIIKLGPARLPRRTMRYAPAARSASSNAPATPSRWCGNDHPTPCQTVPEPWTVALAAQFDRHLEPHVRTTRPWTATPPSRMSPIGSTKSARSIRSRRPPPWPNWPTNGRRRASRTSGAMSRWCRKCRARAAPPARCMARCNRAR